MPNKSTKRKVFRLITEVCYDPDQMKKTMKMAHVTKEREYSGFTHEEAAIVVLLTDNKLHRPKEVAMNFRYERVVEELKLLTTKVQ